MPGKPFPWAICDVQPELVSEINKFYSDADKDFVRVGPKGYFLNKQYKEVAADIYNLQLKNNDIIVLGYPRTGTTRVREIIWIIANDWNFAKAESTQHFDRFFVLAGSYSKMSKLLDEDNKTDVARFISFHLPLSLLPPDLLDTCKVVYMARDPRDVAVSLYHLHRLLKIYKYNGDFKTFWRLFVNSAVQWSPYFENLKEAWEMRNHPNMLFLFYEDMSKDLSSAIRKIASFLDKPCNEEQVLRMCEHLNIDNFRKNTAVNLTNYDGLLTLHGEQSFIRKGKSGDWRNYFDEDMTQDADRWIAHNLQDTDLRFPQD